MGAVSVSATCSFGGDDPLFERIATDLTEKSYSIIPNALPPELGAALLAQIHTASGDRFRPAAVGRDLDHTMNQFVRRNSICWIEGQSPAENEWLAWSETLRQFLNRQLFLGLECFESHFAHYASGDFYRRHLDAFKSDGLPGKGNRVLSLVAYFNPGWQPDDGGELLIYEPSSMIPLLKVTPAFGTLVVFLSEDVPHEVLPARRDRFSIAGWFRRPS